MAHVLKYVRKAFVDVLEGDMQHHVYDVDVNSNPFYSIGFARCSLLSEVKLPDEWYTNTISNVTLQQIRSSQGEYVAESARNTYDIWAPHDYNNYICRRAIYYAGLGLLHFQTRYHIGFDSSHEKPNTWLVSIVDEKEMDYTKMGECSKEEESTFLSLGKEAEEFLNKRYPDWKNPLAYWNESLN